MQLFPIRLYPARKVKEHQKWLSPHLLQGHHHHQDRTQASCQPLKSSNEAITGSHPQSRILSPHLQLKNWMRSPGVKKRKVDVEDSAETKEKKDLSSDLEEEGTASDNHEDELEERRKYSTCDTNNHNNYTDDNK